MKLKKDNLQLVLKAVPSGSMPREHEAWLNEFDLDLESVDYKSCS